MLAGAMNERMEQQKDVVRRGVAQETKDAGKQNGHQGKEEGRICGTGVNKQQGGVSTDPGEPCKAEQGGLGA